MPEKLESNRTRENPHRTSAWIGVFAYSTFDTDNMLVKDAQFYRVIALI